MKKTYYTMKDSTRLPLYTPPHTWVTGNLLREALLNESNDLKTTIKDGYAQEDGRGNEWNGFDESELGSSTSLWDD